MATPDRVNKTQINSINNAITETYGEITAETALKFSVTYCVNRRASNDSIENIVAPFQRIFPVYPIYNWVIAVMFVVYAVWALCNITQQDIQT